jgi:hypothetical protein
MFKLAIPLKINNGNFAIIGLSKPPPQATPFYYYHLHYYLLNSDLRKWMEENYVRYEIDYIGPKNFDLLFLPHSQWYIVFSDPEKALLFKLTWC